MIITTEKMTFSKTEAEALTSFLDGKLNEGETLELQEDGCFKGRLFVLAPIKNPEAHYGSFSNMIACMITIDGSDIRFRYVHHDWEGNYTDHRPKIENAEISL